MRFIHGPLPGSAVESKIDVYGHPMPLRRIWISNKSEEVGVEETLAIRILSDLTSHLRPPIPRAIPIRRAKR